MFLPLCLAFFTAAAPSQQAPKPAENSICPVMGSKVTEKSATVTVKGQAYRICCNPCGPKLEKSPDKYLNPDGKPKNESKKK